MATNISNIPTTSTTIEQIYAVYDWTTTYSETNQIIFNGEGKYVLQVLTSYVYMRTTGWYGAQMDTWFINYDGNTSASLIYGYSIVQMDDSPYHSTSTLTSLPFSITAINKVTFKLSYYGYAGDNSYIDIVCYKI